VLLGVLQAGAVYVPLEPTYPRGRIDAILEDTRPALILSQGALVDRLGLARHPVLAFDRDGARLDAERDDDPAIALEPSQPAYVYYTSGTTGRPKGVVGTHANLAFYVRSAHARYAWSSRDVSPAIARFSFSISMFELLCPLAAGGTLVVLDREPIAST
jgi:non-ribosomal peptide synthetase component F